MNVVLSLTVELIKRSTLMLYPIIPSTSVKVLKIFNINEKQIDFNSITNHEILKKNTDINKISILFKKIEK